MANYYASARTNMFAVKNPDAFIEAIAPIMNGNDGELWDEMHNGVRLFGLGFTDAGFVSGYVDDDGEFQEVDLVELIASHLQDDWVCIMMETGAEKLRYLNGYSVCFNNKNEMHTIDLNGIYSLAANLGVNCTSCEY